MIGGGLPSEIGREGILWTAESSHILPARKTLISKVPLRIVMTQSLLLSVSFYRRPWVCYWPWNYFLIWSLSWVLFFIFSLFLLCRPGQRTVDDLEIIYEELLHIKALSHLSTTVSLRLVELIRGARRSVQLGLGENVMIGWWEPELLTHESTYI